MGKTDVILTFADRDVLFLIRVDDLSAIAAVKTMTH